MMPLRCARALIAYDRWANGRVLDAALRLDAAALDDDATMPNFGSIRQNLAHGLGAQTAWLARVTGEPRMAVETGTAGQVRASYEAVNDRWSAFVESLDDAGLARRLTYQDSAGVERSAPIWAIVAHVVNHGTHHRAETGLLLDTHTASPGDLDMVFFETETTADDGGGDPGDYVRMMLAYDRWANARLLDAAAAADARSDETMGMGHGTARATLQHLVATPHGWMRYLAEPAPPPTIALDTVDGLSAAARVTNDWMTSWSSAFQRDDWERGFERRFAGGEVERAGPLWWIFVHLVNHGTQHRAEAGMMLGSAGHSPGDMDLIFHVYDRGL